MSDVSLNRQPRFEMAFQQQQSRLTTFFRLITAIPGMLLLSIWSIALWVTVPVAWFALLFTARYPGGLYDFHASFARYATYIYSYLYLATDRWPGFSGAPEVDYPVHLRIGEPLPEYNRMKVLFRLIVGIPVWLIGYAMNLVAQIAAVIAWFAIVFTGREPEGIYQMLEFTQQADREALEPGAPSAGSGELTPLTGEAPAPAPAPAEQPDLGSFDPPSSPPPG